jgi:PKD repeat protein
MQLNRLLTLLPTILIFFTSASAQNCTYLAYDYFGASGNTPLNGSYSGQGWASGWVVQNNDNNVPGYQISSNLPMQYADLQTIGNRSSGGLAYLTAGRFLDNTTGGAFDDYLDNNNQIGAAGTTLWISVLLRKDLNNDQNVYASLHDTGLPWCEYCPSTTSLVGIGYYGSASNVSGQRRWSLRINGTVYPTSIPVTVGSTAFLVLRIDFGATTTLSLHVNPATLGNTTPTPDLVQNTTSPIRFRSLALYLGDGAGNGSMDEIRFASTYACVAPNTGINVSVPPYAAFSITPADGQAPLLAMFDGSASSDPDGAIISYNWTFGEGTSSGTGVTTSHTYNSVGILTVALTVMDDDSLTNTAYRTITVRDENNSFGCLTSMTLIDPAHCNADGGHLRVNQGIGNSFTLRNSSNAIIPVSSGSDYTGLDAGSYLLTVTGTNGCSDTFHLVIPIDSTYCANWQPDSCRMPMGTNSSGFADWVPERPLRNLMKHIRQEIVTYTDDCFCWNVNMENELTLDADGYPTQIPQNTTAGSVRARLILSSDEGNLQTGKEYVLLYDGIGTLQMQGAVNVSSSTPGRIQFTNTGGGNIFFNLVTSESGNHVRNIRLLRLADEGADLVNHPFYEGFLEKIAPFNAIRFMDWGATNNNPVVQWSERTPVSFRTYGMEEGVPYEVMIQLANYTSKNVWICVPHAADENYIREMARLFRDNLDPNLTIYLEYSNEVWNWLFQQAHYNVQTAPSNLGYGRAYAEKSRRVSRLWFEEFGAQSTRIKRVLGLQAGFNYLNEQILSQIPDDEWDYGSPTWYFGLDHGATGNPVLHAGSTPQDVVLNAQNAWLGFKESVKQDYDNVKLFGKGIINYEGGQHFTNFTVPPYIQAMYDAQYTTQMYDLYDQVLDTIRTWGSELPFAFSLAGRQESIYGSWGHVSDIDTPQPYLTTAPKYQALLDNFCSDNCPPLVVLGNNNPIPAGTFQAGKRVVAYGTVPNGNNVIMQAGEAIELPAGFQVLLGGEVLATPVICIPD